MAVSEHRAQGIPTSPRQFAGYRDADGKCRDD
jgi:hypothetical protein